MLTDRLAVFGKALRDQRRGLVLWALGFAVMTVVYSSYYQQIDSDPKVADALNSLPDGLARALNMTDLSSAAGYLEGTVFGLLGPVLIVIFAVLAGTRAIAAEEELGVLDLYLAHPLRRQRLVLQRFGAFCVQILALGAVVWLVLTLLSKGLDMNVSAGRLAGMSLALALLGLCFASVALAVGGAVGKRGVALGISAGTAVVTYLFNSVLAQVHGISWLKYLSPFYYLLHGDPLVTGYPAVNYLVLLLMPLVLLGVTLPLFERRDLNV